MKKITLLLAALMLSFVGFTQCNDYYVIDEGNEWTYENFNARGKSSGKNQQKVTAYQKSGNGFTATIHSTFYNDKGKMMMEGDLEMRCEDGTLIMDMRKFIPEEQQKAFGSYEMKMEAENLELPSKLSVGQSLKNGSITMTAVGSPIPMKLSVDITNRKVEAKETLTTPAGTFECYKITGKTSTKTQMGVNMSFEFSTIEWIAEKAGMVKSETFDKNGKSMGTTVLAARK
jgi:hypothetical protein